MAPTRIPTTLLLFLSASLAAQDPDLVLLGKAPNAQYGSSVTCPGDVDGDGHPDLVVGAPIDRRTTDKAGAVEVRSGKTGALLYTWLGGGAGDELGFGAAGAGDVDADGHDDVIVGVLGGVGPERSFIGHARVYSGKTGVRLHTFDGSIHYDFYGLAVSGLGDLDGDGHSDLAIGCPGGDVNGQNSGYLEVRSGASGALAFKLLGDQRDDQFGWFVRPVGDTDGDRTPDFLVGAPGHLAEGKPGYARLFSGRSGEVLLTVRGEADGDRLGWSVATIGDVDRDGTPDLLVGAPFHDAGAADTGAVYVFSGKDGARLCKASGTEADALFGWSVTGAGGDLDHDLVPDFWVGAKLEDANGPDSGAVHLVSARTGAVILSIAGRSAGDEFGFSVADLGAVHPDGDHALAVGARSDDAERGEMVGATLIYRVRPGAEDRAPSVIPGPRRVEAFSAPSIAPSEPVEPSRAQPARGVSWTTLFAVGLAIVALVAVLRLRS